MVKWRLRESEGVYILRISEKTWSQILHLLSSSSLNLKVSNVTVSKAKKKRKEVELNYINNGLTDGN